jgi:hypothetical protein
VPNLAIWTELGWEFKKVLLQIWVLGGPADLYEGCRQLSESLRFQKVLNILSGNSQITFVKAKAGNAEDKQMYPNLIDTLKSTLSIFILEHAKPKTAVKENKAQQVSGTHY